MSADLRDWNRGDVLEATHLQEGVSALRKLLSVPRAGMGTVDMGSGGRIFRAIVGKVVTTGPKGQADFSDARYWVREQYISQKAEPLVLKNTPNVFQETAEGAGPPLTYAVTNLTELADNTHTLVAGTYVWFFAMADNARGAKPHFLMSEGGAGLPAGQYDGQIPQTTSQLTLGMNFLRLVNVPPV